MNSQADVKLTKIKAEEKKGADEIQIQMAQIDAKRAKSNADISIDQSKIQANMKLTLKALELKLKPLPLLQPPHNRDAKSPKLLAFVDENEEVDIYLFLFESVLQS